MVRQCQYWEECFEVYQLLCKKYPYSEFFWSEFSRIYQIYPVNLRIQSECGKIRARKNSEYGHFSRSKWCKKYLITSYLICMLGDILKFETESHVCPLISQELESILDFFSGLTRLITVQRNVARECYENFCPKCIYISNVLNSWGINHSKT